MGEVIIAEILYGFGGWSSSIHRVSGAGSGFPVGYWQSFDFGGGTGYSAIILWGLDTFLIFPNFPKS